jgi:hypothetical protein
MAVTIIIADSDLSGLSAPARQQLETTVREFSTDLISEANRLEAANRSPSDAPDVNAQMVRDASIFVRKGMARKSPSIWVRVGRVAAAVLSLIVGVAWDKDKLQDSTYLVTFGLLFAAAFIAVTVVATKD